MKVQIRDQLRQIAFPEMTSLNTPEVIAKTKGAKKRGRDPSFWEHVDAQFPDSQASQTKPSLSKQKGARIGKTTPTPNPPKEILHIDQMPLFMHSYIDDIIDVEGDGYCGYRVVAVDQNKSEDDYNLIRLVMLRELNLNRERYLRLYGSKRRLNYIIDAMYPPPNIKSRNEVAPKEKWLTFPDMGHIIATHYNKVVVQLTKHTIGISETFFPLRGSPPIDPSSKILCIGLIPNHFVYVKLKDGCPLPPTCLEWRNHHDEEAAAWEYSFMDRQNEFVELMGIERGARASNKDNPIDV
jgi:histone-lysine N-methyltransferase SETD2